MTELSLIAKATAVLALSLSVAAIVRRARASVRALILAAAFGSVLIIPVAAIVIPPVTVTIPNSRVMTRLVPPPARAALPASSVGHVRVGRDAAPFSSSWPTWSVSALLRVVWLVGVVVCFFPMVSTVWRIRSVRRTGSRLTEESRAAETLATEAGIRRPIAVLQSEEVTVPVTCGVFRPIVLMPTCAERWTVGEIRHALIHEIEHVRRGDWVVQLIARAACAVYWFHPLAWVAWRRLRLECERACDDAVVCASDETAYAEQLVTLARQVSVRPLSALSMANRSDLSARVAAVLDVNQRRGRAGVARAAITLSAAAVVLLAIAPLQAVGLPGDFTPTTRDQMVRDRQGTATISGYVYDPLGAVVDDMPIMLFNSPNIGFVYGDVTRTDASGYFTFTKIPSGSYFLNAAIDSFPPITVGLEDGEDVTQDVRMAFAPLMSYYVVCAECPPRRLDPWIMPESLRREFERDREATWSGPAVGPAPVGGWEFDQPRVLQYPAGPKKDGIAGTVVIEGRIGADGFVTALRVLSGHPDLANDAMTVLKEQQWEPARVRGVAVDVPMHAEVTYILKR